ncbi:MAG TPA: alkaline phosphatase family protein [Bryobacteraceae bacterium]|nr:alkaline phosphatase family protein [Bryobacteraceae bacterium]
MREPSDIRFAALPFVCLVFLVSCGITGSQKNIPRVIVLGVDGMDPQFVQNHWSALPNLERLHRQGSFKALKTSTPPQSPVAWSTFITGMDPDGHGIYDFVHRDPKTYLPFSSMSKTEEPRHTLSLGPYLFPLSKGQVIALRRGKAFWQILADHNIPVTMIRMPTNYPPLEAGKAIAGMGTPDLRGTFGTFAFYTDDPEEISRSVSGGRIVKVPIFQNRVTLPIEGPVNSLRKDHRASSVDLTVDVDPHEPAARLAIGDSLAIVRQGEWSDWLRAEFPLIPGLASATGMFRVYAKQLHPRFELYTSPVNIDPEAPELPISAPASYSREVARATGRFYTQGIAEDTSALRQGVFSLADYLAQSRLVFEDEHKLLRYALANFRQGMLFVYFSSIDQNSHMLWGKHEPELLQTYQAVDAAIGEVMAGARGADLIVMSDHGFTRFDRAFNLNTWLWKNGYLALEGGPGEDDVPFARVDWSKTKAYAIGLNGLYLNLAGREMQGIVAQGAGRQALLRRISQELIAFRDPVGGRQVVETVSSPEQSNVAPDLIVGYARGYRGSWQTALGGVPPDLMVDNTDAWVGDHCINAADVPGVLFSSGRVHVEDPHLKDVTVSLLRMFGISAGQGMSGRDIL